MRNLFLALTAAAAVAATAAAAAEREEASIPFPNHGGIRNFHTEGRDILYVQDRRRQWYRATLAATCLDLPYAHSIAVETRGSSSFDRFSAILVGRERCQLSSLERSGPPPKKHKKKRS
jgi:hypothetical protein